MFRRLPRAEETKIVGDSLRYALDLHRNPERHSFEHYGIGPRAYANWVRAVEAGHGGSHGHWWNATVWAECRQQAGSYFAELAGSCSGGAAARARELSTVFQKLSGLLSRVSRREMVPDEKVALLHEARHYETEALEQIEDFLALVGGMAEV